MLCNVNQTNFKSHRWIKQLQNLYTKSIYAVAKSVQGNERLSNDFKKRKSGRIQVLPADCSRLEDLSISTAVFTLPIMKSMSFLGRLRRVDLITWVRCPYVRPYAKSFSDSDEIWYVGRGRWVMHDGVPYDPIQGQGHETFKVRNSSIFKIYLPAIFNVSWQMTSDSETTEKYLTFVRSRFLISVLVFVSRDFELWRVSVQFANAFAIAITFARWRGGNRSPVRG